MLLYFGKDIRVEVRGEAWRTIECGHCGTQFRYYVEKTAAGTGHAPFYLGEAKATRSAQAKAERKLHQLLECDPSPVPCPTCAKYQDDMLPSIRRNLYRWMWSVAVILWAIAPLTFFPAAFLLLLTQLQAWRVDVSEDWKWWAVVATGAISGLLPGFACYLIQKYRQWQFDPNRDIPESERFKVANSLAQPTADKSPKP